MGEGICKKEVCASMVERKPWKRKGELRLLGWMSCNECLHSVCHLYSEKEAQQEISSYLGHKRKEENVKCERCILKNTVKKKSSTNFSWQIKQRINLYILTLQTSYFSRKYNLLTGVCHMPSLCCCLCLGQRVPKAMKAVCLFLCLLYRGQKLLLLRIVLHSEKWLLFPVYISKVSAGVTTKSCQLLWV